MNTKKCFKCGIVKPLNEFYKHPQMSDGYTNKCKECAKKENKENRNKKLEYYQEYDRQRADLPKRVKARKEYAEKCKLDKDAKHRKYISDKKYRKNNPEKSLAKSRLQHKITEKKIMKPSCCSICGKKTNLQAHHSDYSRPLEVLWVCDSCHKMIHKELRKLERENKEIQNEKREIAEDFKKCKKMD